jgi:hypothetical protein
MAMTKIAKGEKDGGGRVEVERIVPSEALIVKSGVKCGETPIRE